MQRLLLVSGLLVYNTNAAAAAQPLAGLGCSGSSHGQSTTKQTQGRQHRRRVCEFSKRLELEP